MTHDSKKIEIADIAAILCLFMVNNLLWLVFIGVNLL